MNIHGKPFLASLWIPHQITPDHSPKNPKEHALNDFDARFTNIIISGTENKIIVSGFGLLDVMISLLCSPITGPTGNSEFEWLILINIVISSRVP